MAMNFCEAIARMKEGMRVKRDNWSGEYLYMDSSNGVIHHVDQGIDYVADAITTVNTMATDWKLFGGDEATLNTFGEALQALKEGKRVTRKGWNGKGMYLYLKPSCVVKREWCRDPRLIEAIDANGGDEILALGTICMYTHDASGRNAILTGWLASQSDMLTEDWIILED